MVSLSRLKWKFTVNGLLAKRVFYIFENDPIDCTMIDLFEIALSFRFQLFWGHTGVPRISDDSKQLRFNKFGKSFSTNNSENSKFSKMMRVYHRV